MATGVFRVILWSIGFNNHTIYYDVQYPVRLSEYGGDPVSTGRRGSSIDERKSDRLKNREKSDHLQADRS
jgi:hypothetical protein